MSVGGEFLELDGYPKIPLGEPVSTDIRNEVLAALAIRALDGPVGSDDLRAMDALYPAPKLLSETLVAPGSSIVYGPHPDASPSIAAEDQFHLFSLRPFVGEVQSAQMRPANYSHRRRIA